MAEEETRIERDSMGEVEVPAHAKWRAQTQRAIENFPISGAPLAPALIAALARIKAAVARLKVADGTIDRGVGEAIAEAADAVVRGEWDAEFPIDVFQTGSGTSSNMNMNEVLATLAAERVGRPIHPNDDVNHPMSSNDMFPSAIHIAAVAGVREDLIPALEHLAEALERKRDEIAEVARATGLPLTEAGDHFEAQGARDALVELSGQLRTIAISLTKISNDLRWMGSGPRAGLAEINLPDLQPGSSIMPGKVNPVVPEATLMVAAQIVGNDAAIAWGGAAGSFELNVMLPMIGRNLLESIRLLANVNRLLADRCIDGITANVDRMRDYAEGSPAIVTPLNRYLGYEEAASIAKQALAERRSIRDVVVERGHVRDGRLTEAELDEALDVRRMTRP